VKVKGEGVSPLFKRWSRRTKAHSLSVGDPEGGCLKLLSLPMEQTSILCFLSLNASLPQRRCGRPKEIHEVQAPLFRLWSKGVYSTVTAFEWERDATVALMLGKMTVYKNSP